MGHQPDREPKGNPPKKVIYLCDKKMECSKSFGCGEFCNHTTDIRHAVNFINIGNENYVEERPETPTIDAIPIDYMRSQIDCEKWEEIITRWKEHGQKAD